MHEHLIQGGFLVPGAGLAMVVGPDRVRVLRGVGADALDDLRPGEIGLILDSGHEVHQIPPKHRNLDWVRANLRRLGDGETLLRLLLQGLDHDLSERSRRWSIDLAEPMLTSGAAADFASRRLLGCPVPDDADLDGGLRLARSANCSRVVGLYADMVRLRPALADLHDAWKATCANQTPDFPGQALRRQLIDGGIFERCARSLMARDRLAISTLPLDATLLASLSGPVQQPAKFLAGFSNVLIGKLSDNSNSVPFISVEMEKDKDSERDDDPITSLIQNGVEEASLSERETPRTYSGDLIEKIENQKKNIVKEFARGREERAWRFVQELVEYQLANSRPEHLAKSLCDIAARLNSNLFTDASLKLYSYAHAASYNDPFPLVGKAEVLKATGRLSEALAAYEDAVARFPDDVVAQTGRAEVLKAMGHLGKALAAYEDAVARFPENVVARNGRAEVLKAMGRLGEALAAYEDAVAHFSESVVARVGRAEVLKAMGRLGEALAAYEDAAVRFPNDVVPRTGRAEVLKSMGRLGEALAAYEDAAVRFPNDVVARNGRAEVLKSMGRLGEALAAYEDVVARFPENVVARNGRAEVLKSMGCLGEALMAYEDAVARFPESVVARNGRAEVLKAMGRLGEALAAYEDAAVRFPENVVARNGRAEVLKAMGRLGEALVAYEDAAVRFPADVVARNGRAEVLKSMGRLGEALAAYEDVVSRFPENVVARNGRAEVLKAMGCLGEALAAYEDAVSRFPENVVARTGRAEVLKAMGRRGEALAAYEDVVARFPENVVARTGRAEVLKAMGRLGEALAAYEDAVSRFPENVVARTGRAEVLKAMGRFGEALDVYREVLAGFPNEEFARNGKASTLVSLGRTREVIDEFKAIQPIARGDWISCHILAMAYLRSGEPEEARRVLEMGAETCPFPDCHWYFAMTLAYLDVARGDSGRAADRLRPAMAANPTPATVILFSHALAASGNKKDAATSLDRLGSSHVTAQVLSLKDALTKRYGLRGQGELPNAQREALDKQIAEGEFALLLEAA